MAARVARLQSLYEEAGRPGARAFRTYARRKGEDINTQEAQQFVAGQSTAQVFHGQLPSDGKVTASRSGMRLMADLMSFVGRKKQPGDWKYCLIVVDVFSRKAFVEKLRDNESNTVLAAFRRIVARNGGVSGEELATDGGREFFGPKFQQYLKDNGTVHSQKISTNSIAVVDRAIQSIKKILANLQQNSEKGWSAFISKSCEIYNDREHGHLYGESPDGLKNNEVVRYHLEAENGESVQHNNKKWRKKVGSLSDKGAFRTPLPKETWPRIDQPRFGNEVHTVDSYKGANVIDDEDRNFPVRNVLAVAHTSADINVNDELIPGSRKRELQKEHLRRYAESLKAELANTPRGEMSFNRACEFLRTRPGFADTSDVYKLPKEGRYVKFLRLFAFEMSGSGPGMTVRRPAGRGAADGAGGRGRPAGAVDIAPRVPRRGLPNATAITFQPDNPHRGGTAAYTRYDLYKSAQTVGEAREQGATPQDLKGGLQRGHAMLG